MSKIKFYLIEYPINYVKDLCHRIRMGILNKFRKWIYDYEINDYLNRYISEPYYGTRVSNLRVGVFSPVLIVSKMLEKHFGFRGYFNMNVHAIDVDTQQDDAIEVTIKLHRPGYLIGKGGKDINAVTDMLERYFCKRVHINIVEVREDVNIPYYGY
jgi:predicted RNA-binding protein YlqC (UPF0109 family)